MPAKKANTFSTAIEPIKSTELSVWPPICGVNKVLSVNAEDFDCRVQANVTRKQLNEYLREDDQGIEA